MDASWEVFVSRLIFPRPTLIRVDTALVDAAPLKSYPISIVCSIGDLEVTKELLPTNAAMKRISLFETKAAAIAEGTGIYAGRVSFNKLTALNFYAADSTGLIGKFKTSVELSSIAPFDCRTNKDSEWQRYFYLLAETPRFRHRLLNYKARNYLLELGDEGVSERKVLHVAHFWNGEDLSKYIDFLRAEGYAISSSAKKAGGGGVWSVWFAKNQTPSTLEGTTLNLSEKAYELNGGYDGWRPQVSKAP